MKLKTNCLIRIIKLRQKPTAVHTVQTYLLIAFSAFLLLGIANAASDDGGDQRRAYDAVIERVALQLTNSTSVEDQLAGAILSESRSASEGNDSTVTPALYRELLNQASDQPLVIYRARTYCVSHPATPYCNEFNLTQMHLQADPGNGLIHLVDAAHFSRTGEPEAMWRALEHAAEAQSIRSHYPDEVKLFLSVLGRHPNVASDLCEEKDCPAVATVTSAYGFAMALVDYSGLVSSICSHPEQPLTNEQTSICLKIARKLQGAKTLLSVRVGAGMEKRILTRLGTDSQRLSQIEAEEQRYVNLPTAHSHAYRLLDMDHNPEDASYYVNLLLDEGQLVAMQELAKIAGISAENPPPNCLTPEMYEQLRETMREHVPNASREPQTPVCPDYLMP